MELRTKLEHEKQELARLREQEAMDSVKKHTQQTRKHITQKYSKEKQSGGAESGKDNSSCFKNNKDIDIDDLRNNLKLVKSVKNN